MRISLGPVLYYWDADRLRAFYRGLAGDSAVDTFYLGETVCSRRRGMSPEEWVDLGRELAAAGHEVVLSTLTLVEARSEAGQIRRHCDNGEFLVEANDFTAVEAARERGIPFVAGPALNLYHGRSVRIIKNAGAVRWVPPVELSREALERLLDELHELGLMDELETEVFAFGRMPLAYSARCFTARHYDRPKDQCGFVCLDHPEGLTVRTRNGEPFLVINGIQSQSYEYMNLLPAVAELQEMGVSRLRLSPRPAGMKTVIDAFRAAADGDTSVELTEPALEMQCDGYWHGEAGRVRSAALGGMEAE